MAFIFLVIIGGIVGMIVWQTKKATPDAAATDAPSASPPTAGP